LDVVDDDENDDIIITNLQQETEVESMYYDWTREEGGVVYPPRCFDAIDKILLGEDGNGTIHVAINRWMIEAGICCCRS